MKGRSGFDILRQRRIQNDSSSDNFINLESGTEEIIYRKNQHKVISSEKKIWLFLMVLHALIFYLIQYKHYDFPKPLSNIEAGNNIFSEERARKFLQGLTSFGMRLVGSEENEKMAVKHIMNELEQIKQHSLKKIQVDMQTASGSFDLDFLGGFTSVYDNIKNIVVRLSLMESSANNNKHQNASALLVNCHYDSAFSSPGASDDAVSCATMMEVLRVMSKDDTASFKHDVIFLFNGAEETILQASHAFVTQHAWFKDVRAFVNLEAAGANGKEMLFQATKGAEWMIELYASAAPDAHISVLGQEIFQSGVVPSDTDFRIFRDFGGLPGIDMAYTRNGYVYHTRHDSIDKIAPGCLQRTGNNILSLVHAITTTRALTNQKPDEKSKLFFMDVSGMTTILFPASRLFIFNYVIIIAAMSKIGFSLRSHSYRKGFLLSIGCMPVVWLTSTASSSLVALFLDVIGRPMTWFSYPLLLIPLYSLPSLVVNVLAVHFLKSYWSKKPTNRHLINPGHVLNDTQMLYAALVLTALSWKQIASSFILTNILLFFLIHSIIQTLISSSSKPQSKPQLRMLILHFVFSLPSIYILSFSVDGVLATFIPIMGRSGSVVICDVVMAVLVSMPTNIFMSLHLSLVAAMGGLKRVMVAMTTTIVICVLIVTFTNLGKPFSDHPQHPTNKRVFLQHSRRTFHGNAWDDQSVSSQDNGLLVIPLDRTELQHLDGGGESDTGKKLMDGFSFRPCINQPYCGWAFYLPVIDMIGKIYAKEAEPLAVKGVQVSFGNPTIHKHSIDYSFTLLGPHYMNVYLSVEEGMEVVGWSHGKGRTTTVPSHLSRRKHFFFLIISASTPTNKHHFKFSLKCPTTESSCKLGQVQLAVAGNNFHSPTSPTIINFLHDLPPWVSPVASESTYDTWVL